MHDRHEHQLYINDVARRAEERNAARLTQPDPAAELRAAATRLRECAGAIAVPEPVNSEPWHTDKCADAGYDNCPCIVAHGRIHPGTDHEIPVRYIADAETPEIAQWIALMHPGIGEPLADWLDAAAAAYSNGDCKYCHCSNCRGTNCACIAPALAVARALLGGQP